MRSHFTINAFSVSFPVPNEAMGRIESGSDGI